MNIFKGRTEFKYRIWDLTEEEMILPPSPYSSAKGPVFLSMDGCHYIDGVYQKHIYMQYLGILDTTGEEICEGDILGYGDNSVCIVQWNAEKSKFEAVEYGNTDDVRYHDMSATSFWKILGNVFESPDLVEYVQE